MKLGTVIVFATCFELVAICTPLTATQHLIDINEIYSNADGSVQYVELITLANGQTVLFPTSIQVFNADGSMETIFYDFVFSYPIGNNRTILVATTGFEAAFGFAPDFVVPDGLISSPNGRVVFFKELGGCIGIPSCEIDAVAYGSFTGRNGVHGIPAPALPRDGCFSLTRIGDSNNNEIAWAEMEPTPMRTDFTTGPSEIPFIRGDVNGDGALALIDAVFILSFAFLDGRTPMCLKTADVDGDGLIEGLVDTLFLLNSLFIAGSPTPALPFPNCDFEPPPPIPCSLTCLVYDCP